MINGLVQGLQPGLKTLNGKWSSVNELFDANFATPATVGIGGNGTFASTFATDEWLLQETSGTHANNVGSETLASTGGLQGQTAPGVWDGSSYTARKAWEVTGNTDDLTASASTAGDFNAQDTDFAVRVIFRGTPGVWLNSEYLISKLNTTSVGGWRIYVTGGQEWTFGLWDNANNNDGVAVTTLIGGAHDDGAVHMIEARWDNSTGTAYTKGDLASEVSKVLSTVTGTTNNSVGIQANGYSNTGTAGFTGPLQILYIGVSVGSNAQNFYNETVVLPGADPSGLLTTQTRASAISVPVAADLVATFSEDTLPIGYNSNFSDTNKLGLYCNSAVTNLLDYSEDFSQWTNTLGTETANDADAPDGFRSAMSIQAGATNDDWTKNFTTVGSTEYTFSVWIKRDGGSDVGFKLQLYDLTNTTIMFLSGTLTATDTWQKFEIQGTTGAGGISTRAYVRIETDTEALHVWGAQANLGDGRGAYIRTAGATAALVYCDYEASGTAGQYCKAASGEIETVHVMPHSDSGNHRIVNVNQGNNANMIDVTWSAGSQILTTIRDSATTAQATLTHTTLSANTEYTTVAKWDETGGLALGGGEDAASYINGADEKTDVGSYTTTDTLTLVQIGNYRAPASIYAPDGFIQRVRIWDQER